MKKKKRVVRERATKYKTPKKLRSREMAYQKPSLSKVEQAFNKVYEANKGAWEQLAKE